MKVVGSIDSGIATDIYYSDDNFNFFIEKKGTYEKVTKKDLETFTFLLNNPWSQNHITYETKLNCKDAYTKMDVPEDETWKTTLIVIGYDNICSELIGYGKDELESFVTCKNLFDYLTKTYFDEDGKE